MLALQPDGRGALRVRRPPLGGLGRRPLAARPGSFSRTSSATATTPTYDALLCSLWVVAILAFAAAVEAADPEARNARAALGLRWSFGVCSAAPATKLTGWFLPLPFLVWAALAAAIGALLTILAGRPSLAWRRALPAQSALVDRADHGRRAVPRSNLTRGETIPIPMLFLGTVYQTPDESLPWYNTLVWTVLVTPVGFLLLAPWPAWAGRSIAAGRAVRSAGRSVTGRSL